MKHYAIVAQIVYHYVVMRFKMNKIEYLKSDVQSKQNPFLGYWYCSHSGSYTRNDVVNDAVRLGEYKDLTIEYYQSADFNPNKEGPSWYITLKFFNEADEAMFILR
jgi:hypothetical protein